MRRHFKSPLEHYSKIHMRFETLHPTKNVQLKLCRGERESFSSTLRKLVTTFMDLGKGNTFRVLKVLQTQKNINTLEV